MPPQQRLAHACRLQPPLSAAAAPRSAPAPSRAAADASPIPSIDVGALFGDDADAKMRTAQEIAVACEEIGFFSIHNHGVPTEIVEAAWQQTAAFFALPEATKQQAALMIADVYDYGYSPLGGETLAAGKQLELGTEQEQEPAPGDLKEMFASGPLTDAFGAPPVQWPVAPAGIRPALTSYYREMEKLSSALLRAFALALELPEAWFEDKIDRHMCSLRTLSYPELEAESLERSAPGQLRASAHTDYGTLPLWASLSKPWSSSSRRALAAWCCRWRWPFSTGFSSASSQLPSPFAVVASQSETPAELKAASAQRREVFSAVHEVPNPRRTALARVTGARHCSQEPSQAQSASALWEGRPNPPRRSGSWSWVLSAGDRGSKPRTISAALSIASSNAAASSWMAPGGVVRSR